MKNTFWRRASQFSPVLVRLLARHRYGAPLSTGDIAERSGISLYLVEAISQSTTWGCCNVLDMRRFIQACECDWENPQQLDRMMSYIRKGATWKFLRVSPHWSTYYEPLLEIYRHSVTKSK